MRLRAHNLLPDQLAKQGLGVALYHLVDKLNRGTLVKFQLTGADSLLRMGQQTEFELYSICLELLHNILKHADATESQLTFSLKKDHLCLTVSDNGQGIDGVGKDGRGLQNVAARVQALNRQWAVESNLDTGVKHSISIPVNATNQVS